MVAGVVITVLVNAVRYTSSESVSHDPSAPNYKPSKNSRPESSISLWARGGGKPPSKGYGDYFCGINMDSRYITGWLIR